jgi:hypothetical protein
MITPFKYGHVQYPLHSTDGTGSLLAVCDPVVATLLDYFAYRITTYVGDALVAASDGTQAPIVNAVETKLPIDPIAIAKADQFKFPLLAVWRKRSDFSDHSINWRQNVARLGIAYILPPMTAGQSIRLWSVLTAVSDIVDHSIKVGHDAGFNNDQTVFFDNDVARARLMTGEHVRIPFGDTMDFQAWLGEMELTETVRPSTEGLSLYTGSDIVITDESVQPGNPIEIIAARTDK